MRLTHPTVKFSLGGHSLVVIDQNICISIPAPSFVLYSHRLFHIGRRKPSFLLPAEARYSADHAVDVISAVPPAHRALPCVFHSLGRSCSSPVSPTGSANCLHWMKPTMSAQIPHHHTGHMPHRKWTPQPSLVPASISPPRSAEGNACTLTVTMTLWGRDNKLNDNREIWVTVISILALPQKR